MIYISWIFIKYLKKEKNLGDKPKLDELTPEALKILFIDESKTYRMIANLFEVKPSRITYLRRNMVSLYEIQ